MTAVIVGYDPECRYASADPAELPLHVCTTNQGQPVRPGQTCFYEAAVQLRELAKVREALR